MAPLKRKRPHDAVLAPEPTTRRTTRQTSIPLLPAKPDPEPRRRRAKLDGDLKEPKINGSVSAVPIPRPRGKENIPLPTNVPTEALKPSRATRHGRADAFDTDQASAAGRSAVESGRGGRALGTTPRVEPAIVPPIPRPSEPAKPPSITPQGGSSATQPPPQSVKRTNSLATSSPKLPAPPQQRMAPAMVSPEKLKTSRPDRNIDKVMLGDICFRAWYPSYYGKEVLGDVSGNSTKGHNGSGSANGTANSGENGDKAHGPGRSQQQQPSMLDRLYVCPCCFKYSKELVAWWAHVRFCEARGHVPGTKIYTHPKGRRTVLVPPPTPASRGQRGRRGGVSSRVTERVVQDEGEWSVWEVDGEQDVLFCQNLSLFAKLFLDNKSVFFDVTGFNYFLLVYTPPMSAHGHSGPSELAHPRPQIIGFFSKEKMSWDGNNLACILVFPPWQRKGLGAMLMGVSYEISRREGILGGPEKPISDLGKRGYKRFWAGEVARWLLDVPLTPGASAETIVDIDECSKATWMAPEDCLMALREMGVVEDAGKGPPKSAEKGEETDVTAATATGGPAAAAEAEVKEVQRVKVNKDAVRKWVVAQKVSLERTCDPDGFIEGYAYPSAAVEMEE